ncbi:MAG: DNA internalization-related competence protein ComEC/Rec2 [Oscillospiraceae bacterium]|nr:DNA internalization-related competence protein ComEC/Rec2 [Oscillospiraceae bacterium]
MRKLMWFTIGFGAACALGAYVFCHWAIAIAALVLSIAFLFLIRKWKHFRIFAAVLLGIALGMGWFCAYDAMYLRDARQTDGQILELYAEATDYSYKTDYGSAVEARVSINGKPYSVILYLKDHKELLPGDHVTGEFRLRYTAGGMEEPTYHRGNGIFLLAYPKGDAVYEEAPSISDAHFPAVLRQRLLTALDRAFPEDTAYFAKALLLGDRSDVSYEVTTSFKVSGISHIIAVSGLHVSILFAVIALLCGRRRYLMALIGIPVLLLFAAVAGFTPSVTRACLMQSLMVLALVFNREYDPLTALAFAVICMLAVNPVVITSASFQLSVGCMAGIFLFSKRITGWIDGFSFWKDWKGKNIKTRIRSWISSGVGVTVSAMFFTTPLVACYFGAVSLISIVTNLLTLWVVSFCFYGIIAVCLLSFVWTQGAALLAWCVSWLIRYVVTAAKLLSSIPLAAVYTKSIFIVLWLVLVYLLIFVFLLSKNRQPFVLICCGVMGLCLALVLSWMEPLTDDTRMTVLDVGQGQCIILQSNGKTYLVDCGGDRDAEAADLVAETLLSQGISRLDGVIVTHYDRDHAGGVGYLLSRVSADAVFLPDSADEDEILQTILPYCSGREIYVNEDMLVQWEQGEITVFAPILSTSDNESGLCVLFRDENCDILITGDLSSLGEKLLLREKELPDLDALVAGHHGSKSSTCEELLAATMPEYAFISVGKDNYYGHPHADVIGRLERIGCFVYRTDEDGTIIFRR